MNFGAKNEFTVRVVYIVPNGVDAWKDARNRATEWLENMQWFFADEMDRHGYGSKTFEIARDDNDALIFNQISSLLVKKEFEKDAVNTCKKVAQDSGLRSSNDVVVFFYESYAIINGKVFNAGTRGGQKNLGGEAFLSSLHLKLARREWIANENGYDGDIFDWISLKPMSRSTLSWNGRGRKLGDVSGAAFGIMGHELGHAFGLHHDMNNDKNRKGNLMGNGCRGMRGYFRPDLTDDFCILTKQDAMLLDKSAFFSVRNLKPRLLM